MIEDRSAAGRLVEAVVVGLAGGALGWSVGWLLGFPWVTGAAGAANGLVSGATGIYDWRELKGWLAALLDSTWALVGTTTSLLLHLVQRLFNAPLYRSDLSYRFGAHLYEEGFALKKGYAFSTGNIVSNAGGNIGLDGEGRPARRLRFVKNHEVLHVWQNRIFGPLFQVGYVAWMLIGVVWASIVWVRLRRDYAKLVETAAYFNNPFEYWAYRRDGYWPPVDAHPSIVWGGPPPDETVPPIA